MHAYKYTEAPLAGHRGMTAPLSLDALSFAGQGLGSIPNDWHILSDFHGM